MSRRHRYRRGNAVRDATLAAAGVFFLLGLLIALRTVLG
jgi:hypothetical protein